MTIAMHGKKSIPIFADADATGGGKLEREDFSEASIARS